VGCLALENTNTEGSPALGVLGMIDAFRVSCAGVVFGVVLMLCLVLCLVAIQEWYSIEKNVGVG
jgi:hypothetical protein